MTFSRGVVVAGLAAGTLLAACQDLGPGMATVTLRLSDAPANFQSATVWVSKVQLVGGDSGLQTISTTPTSYDLLSLQNGVTALLGTATIPAGSYEQLRLIVDSARVVLATGFTFADGDTTAALRVPSGMETGIKVDFAGGVTLPPGQSTMVVDFDVSKSFVLQGPATGPFGVSFKPVIHATVQ
jgi:hypothetical protein